MAEWWLGPFPWWPLLLNRQGTGNQSQGPVLTFHSSLCKIMKVALVPLPDKIRKPLLTFPLPALMKFMAFRQSVMEVKSRPHSLVVSHPAVPFHSLSLFVASVWEIIPDCL